MATLSGEMNSSLNHYQPALDFTAGNFLKIDYLRPLVFNHLKARNST